MIFKGDVIRPKRWYNITYYVELLKIRLNGLSVLRREVFNVLGKY